jgi:hypothetical protein
MATARSERDRAVADRTLLEVKLEEEQTHFQQRMEEHAREMGDMAKAARITKVIIVIILLVGT